LAHQTGQLYQIRGAITHRRQQALWHIQQATNLIIPAALGDIIQHGAGSIGGISQMRNALGQLPNQIGVHGAKQQFAPLRSTPHTGDMLQQPIDLGGSEIGINQKTSFRGNLWSLARSPQRITKR
jgi:hypothetical protein